MHSTVKGVHLLFLALFCNNGMTAISLFALLQLVNYSTCTLSTSIFFFYFSLSSFLLASSGRRLQSKPSPSQRPPRRARPQARRPEARMVVLEQPPIIDETENEEDIRQQGEVHIRTCTSVCIMSLVHNNNNYGLKQLCCWTLIFIHKF